MLLVRTHNTTRIYTPHTRLQQQQQRCARTRVCSIPKPRSFAPGFAPAKAQLLGNAMTNREAVAVSGQHGFWMSFNL
jgi:hypothetical protein